MQIGAVEYLLQRACATPDAQAFRDENEVITYRELLTRGAGIAATLAGHPGPVPILAAKSVSAVAAIAGCLMAGVCYCPLDVAAPAERLALMVDNLGAELVLTTVGHRSTARQAAPQATLVDITSIAPDERAIDVLVAEVRVRVANLVDLDPVYVIYTSGSTGVPKGVTVSNRSLIDFVDWAQDFFALGPGDVLGNQAPLYFDVSMLDIYVGMFAGAEVLLIRDAFFAYPTRLMELLARHGVTYIGWVPSALALAASRGALEGAPQSLRWVVSLGEPMPAGPIAAWMAALPEAQFANAYGPTETTVLSTAYLLTGPPEPGVTIPIGRPSRNTAVYVLDESDVQVAVGEVGHLHIGGSGVALGYWRDPERTAEAFVQNPLHDHYPDRVYRTGDLVRLLPDGVLDFVGRSDTQIKHRGFRIELGEIDVAAASLPGVAVACATYDRTAGEIVLTLQAHDGHTLDPDGLRRGLRDIVPKYMMPGRVNVVEMMPLLGNGKVDRKALR